MPFCRHSAACVLLLALSQSFVAHAQPAPRRRREEISEAEAAHQQRVAQRAAWRAERERREAEAAGRERPSEAAPAERDQAKAKVSATAAEAGAVASPEEAAQSAGSSADEDPTAGEQPTAGEEPTADEEADRRAESTDPTSESTSPPILNVPMPNADGQAAAETASVPGDPWGDAGAGGLLSLRALFQFRYQTTYSERSVSTRDSYKVRERYIAQSGDGYSFNRLFVRLASDPSPYVSFKAVFDFAELLGGDPENVVKQTYITLSPIPRHLELVAGQFKIPVSITELDSSNRWEFAGFGGLNNLMGKLGFISRDLGVMLLGAPFPKAKRMRLSLGIFRGEAKDEHDSGVGTLAARVEVNPNKHFRIGADIGEKLKGYTYNRPFETSSKEELPDPIDPLYPAARHYGKGRVVTADARYKQKGFMLRGEGAYGDRVDLDVRYGAKTFWGAWAIAAYRIDCGSFQLLPAFRAEWMDSNREAKVGVQRMLSGALTVLFFERVRFLIDVTHTEVQAGTPASKQPEPIMREPYIALDNFRGTAQLQLEL